MIDFTPPEVDYHWCHRCNRIVRTLPLVYYDGKCRKCEFLDMYEERDGRPWWPEGVQQPSFGTPIKTK